MPREARKKSYSNIYHIMIRGINRRNIFLDDKDRRVFIKFLKNIKTDSPFLIYAYCLMDNHVHLLLRETSTPLETIMKRIGIKYAAYFNNRYSRSGHLFQDRFKSEGVEDDRYFLTVLRYILRNPVKAGICPEPGDYLWSSYNELFQPNSWVDNEFAITMTGKKDLISFIQMENEDLCMDIDNLKSYRNEKAKELIRQKYKGINYFDLTKDEQEKLVHALYSEGFSGAQICDALNISAYYVRKAHLASRN